jgi:hypothetical protein
MVQTQNQAAAERAAGAAGASLANQQAPRGRIVFLNALPLNALPRSHLRLDILPVANLNELTQWTQRRLQEGYELMHFIRHSATIAALRVAGIPLSEQPNSGLYSYSPGDVIVVVTLRTPQRGQETQQVSPQDLEFWVAAVI